VQIKQRIMATILTATAAVFGFAAPNVFAEVKIAVVDVQAAILNSEEAKRLMAQIQEEFKAEEEQIRSIQSEAAVLYERLQKDGEVMSEAEQRRIVGELQELQNQYEFLVEKIQTLINQRRQQFQQTYAPNLVQAITEVVEEDSYDIVFRAEAVLHYANAINITARVTEKLNQQ